MKKQFIFLFILCLIPSVFAADLSNFPNMFLNQQTRIIVGKSASVEDSIGAIDIATTLQNEMGKDKKLKGAVMDTEISNLESQNSIVVGGPCMNSAAAKLMGYPENCMEGFELGKGFIRLYEFDNGNYALLAAGTLAVDTRRVTRVLSNYNRYQLTGNQMEVTKLDINNIRINTK